MQPCIGWLFSTDIFFSFVDTFLNEPFSFRENFLETHPPFWNNILVMPAKQGFQRITFTLDACG